MSSTREILNGTSAVVGFASVAYGALYYLAGHNFQTPWGAIGHVIDDTATYETYNTLAVEGGMIFAMILMLVGSTLRPSKPSGA